MKSQVKNSLRSRFLDNSSNANGVTEVESHIEKESFIEVQAGLKNYIERIISIAILCSRSHFARTFPDSLYREDILAAVAIVNSTFFLFLFIC